MHQSGAMRLIVLLSFTCAVFAQNIPTIAGVVNAASQDTRLSPACVADIVGSNLGTNAGAGVLIGGQLAATVISTSSTRWRVWIPDSVQPGQTTIQLGASQAVPITLTQYSPALFSADGTGQGIVNAVGYRLASNDSLITPGYQLSETTPARLGDILILDVTGLGAPDRSNEFQPMDTPSVTIGGKPALLQWAFLVTDQTDPDLCYGACELWHYEVMVTLPDALPVHDQPIAIAIGGATSQTLTVPINATPIVNAAVNGASFASQAPLAAGSLASVFGTTFGVADQTAGLPGQNATGVSVAFNGVQAPLLAVLASAGLINLQVPVEMPDSGPAALQVATAWGVSASFTVQLSPAAPGVFRIPSSNPQRPPVAAVLFNNTQWLVTPADFAQELGIPGNCHASGISAAAICGEPARRGVDYIQIYVTGMGKSYPNRDSSQPVLGTGQAAPGSGNPLYWSLLQPTVTVGGVPATVLFCGVAPGFFGLYQINIQVPAAAPTGNYTPLAIAMPNGAADSATTIAVQ
jgi:uncharacterized protein (TIGR03437 family)